MSIRLPNEDDLAGCKRIFHERPRGIRELVPDVYTSENELESNAFDGLAESLDYIRAVAALPPGKRRGPGSRRLAMDGYAGKHAVERWVRAKEEPAYVSTSAFVLAAIYLGVWQDGKHHKHPGEARFDVSERVFRDAGFSLHGRFNWEY